MHARIAPLVARQALSVAVADPPNLDVRKIEQNSQQARSPIAEPDYPYLEHPYHASTATIVGANHMQRTIYETSRQSSEMRSM